MSELIDQAVSAARLGKPIVIPTDTVYGIATSPFRDEPVRRLYALKERPVTQPTALVTASVEALFELVPELRGRAGVIAATLLPGPYTLVLPNPARRFRWLTGGTQDVIGVRVPELPGDSAEIVERVGALVATSANARGGPDPARLEEVPDELRRAAAVVVDGGELPGTASTVIDFTTHEPRVVREGAAPSGDAIARALDAASSFG